MVKKLAASWVLLLLGALTACVPGPADVEASPEDTWTWQVNQDYWRVADCLAYQLNSASEHSWFLQAPRPVTSFEQQWQTDQITLRSVDPWGIEQVNIRVIGVAEHYSRIVAHAKNLERLGGGAPMYYIRAYMDLCAHANRQA